jgi:archaellum component FlaC
MTDIRMDEQEVCGAPVENEKSLLFDTNSNKVKPLHELKAEHRDHAEATSSLNATVQNQVEEWEELQNEVRDQLDSFTQELKANKNAQNGPQIVQEQLKRIFRDIHKQIEEIKNQKMRDFEANYGNFKDQDFQKLEEKVKNLGQLYECIEEVVEKIQEKLEKKEYIGITEMYYLIEKYRFNLKEFEEFQRSKKGNMFDTIVSLDAKKVKEALDEAILVNNEPIAKKQKKRLFYFDKNKVNFYYLDTDLSAELEIENFETIPANFSSVEVENVLYISGGEELNSEFRTMEYSRKTYMLDESQK